MTLSERGLWISMYLECWANNFVPSSPEKLAKFLGFDFKDVNENLTESVLSFFVERDGLTVSPELEDYRNELIKRRQKQSSGGKKSQENRRNKNPNILASQLGATDATQLESHGASSLDKVKLIKSNKDKSIKESSTEEWINEYNNSSDLSNYQNMSKGY